MWANEKNLLQGQLEPSGHLDMAQAPRLVFKPGELLVSVLHIRIYILTRYFC